SFALLLMMPVYQVLYEGAFSHAYHGAIRHAITVGFISMMIMGMGARIIPRLAGLDTARLPRLWAPFVLVNAGCALRGSLQIATDWWPGAFPLVGISGTLELGGLTWWALPLMWALWVSRGQAAGGNGRWSGFTPRAAALTREASPSPAPAPAAGG